MNNQNPANPTILALESAAGACSAALWRDGAVQAHEFAEMARGHAEHLMPMARAVVAAAGATFTDLDGIAVTVGPGTYTGLRIGLAAAKGLGLATGRPVLGVSSLAAVADAAGDHPVIAVALETKRADIYFQIFERDLTPRTPAASASPAEAAAILGAMADVADVCLVGAAAPRVVAEAPSLRANRNVRFPDAAVVAAMIATGRATPLPPDPVYLRPPDVTPPRAIA